MGWAFSAPGWGSGPSDWLPPLWLLPLQDPTAFPVPTFQDLAGFWDLLQLSIEDVTLKFLELQQLKANSWKLLEPKVGGGPFKPRVQTLGDALPQRVWAGERKAGEETLASQGSPGQVMGTLYDHPLGHCPLLGSKARTTASLPELREPLSLPKKATAVV